MKSDANGCSTTKPGQEQYEEYFSTVSNAMRVQYDYRKPSGELFSCVAKSLSQAREKRDIWLAKIGCQPAQKEPHNDPR